MSHHKQLRRFAGWWVRCSTSWKLGGNCYLYGVTQTKLVCSLVTTGRAIFWMGKICLNVIGSIFAPLPWLAQDFGEAPESTDNFAAYISLIYKSRINRGDNILRNTCGNFTTWQKSGIYFGFILNWQTLLKTPQYVSTLLIRTVNFQNFLCIYSKSQTIQFHLFAINEVLCTVMTGPNCTFLLVYMKWSDGWNLQFMVFLWKLYLRLKEQALIYTCQNDWFNMI